MILTIDNALNRIKKFDSGCFTVVNGAMCQEKNTIASISQTLEEMRDENAQMLEALNLALATIERLHLKHGDSCLCVNGSRDVINAAIKKAVTK